MDVTVREHIRHLEERLTQLNWEIMNQDDVKLRNTLEAEIRAANLALSHYRAALEIEQTITRKRA